MTPSAYPEAELESAARDLAQVLFGVEPVRMAPLRRGVMTLKFVVEMPLGARYVVRFYPRTRAHVVCYEPDLLRRCAREGLPVPEVVADSRALGGATHPFLVYRWIEGTTLADRLPALTRAARDKIAGQLVSALSSLASVRINGFGDLIDAANARFPNAAAFFRASFVEGLDSVRRHRLLPPDLARQIASIRADFGSIGPAACLVWGDVSLENTLIDSQDRLAGLLDLEGALAADPLFHLGYHYARYGDSEFFRSLALCWSPPLDPQAWQRIYLYAVIRALRLAKFAHLPLPSGLARLPLTELLPGLAGAVRNLLS